MLAALVIGFRRIRDRNMNFFRRAAAEHESARTEAAQTSPTSTEQWTAVRRDIVSNTQTAERAQKMADVLAAPDLLRFELVGGPQNQRARALGLFSRSRGILFTASSLAPAPGDLAYQLWVLTDGVPINIGVISPEIAISAGAFVAAVPEIPRRVTGMTVTLEAHEPALSPSQTLILTSHAR